MGVALATVQVPAVIAGEIDPLALAIDLAEIGPRVPGSEAHRAAVEVLLGTMRTAGLQEVAAHTIEGHPDLLRLEGELPGESGLEVLLTAHFDTVEASPGAVDNAAGCAAVLAAVARLSETPRRHRLRVILFDGEEAGQVGSRAWAQSLDVAARQAVLAAVNLDMIAWDAERRGAVVAVLTDDGGRRRVAPGWLVSVALAASRSVGPSLAVVGPPPGIAAQLLSRAVFLRMSTDAEALLAAGLPAITLSDADLYRIDPTNHGPMDLAARLSREALDRWVDRLGALVLRLDTMAGRPRDDDQYLAVFGRVWSRRTLYWVGLSVWVLLVFQGLRQVRRRSNRSRRDYLPGFALRFLFLGCVLMLPVFAVVLLVPAALVLVAPRRWRIAPRWKLTVAAAPLLATLVALVWLTATARVESFALGLPAAALLTAALGAMLWLLATELPGDVQVSRASSPSVETADSHSSSEL